MEKDERGRKTRRPLFPRRTTSTALQLAVDHAFTGSYASRFRPLNPPSSLTCPCGYHLRNPHHLIRDCRLHYLTRVSTLITTRGRTLSLPQLFSHSVTVSPSPQSKDEENEKLHKLREYARDFRRQHTTCYVSMARSARRELGRGGG
jgi:hypothetical protein